MDRDRIMALAFRETYDGKADDLREAMDAYAHGLAEKIRAQVRQFKADGILEPDKDWTASGAADLIDPEVSTSPDAWRTST